MSTIAILPEQRQDALFHAVSGQGESVGKTPGEALDALMAQLREECKGTRLLVQILRGDQFFTAQQCERLTELMERWRSLRDQGAKLPPAEQSELDALVAAELAAATPRADALSGS